MPVPYSAFVALANLRYINALNNNNNKGNISLDLNEARDDGVFGCSGISWTICKQCAPRSREITTTTSHHSIFYRLDALPDAQPTVSKH